MNKNSPTKKAWISPVVVMISAASIEAVKAHPSVHENTGHVNTINPAYFNSYSNGNAFLGTKLSAHS